VFQLTLDNACSVTKKADFRLCVFHGLVLSKVI